MPPAVAGLEMAEAVVAGAASGFEPSPASLASAAAAAAATSLVAYPSLPESMDLERVAVPRPETATVEPLVEAGGQQSLAPAPTGSQLVRLQEAKPAANPESPPHVVAASLSPKSSAVKSCPELALTQTAVGAVRPPPSPAAPGRGRCSSRSEHPALPRLGREGWKGRGGRTSRSVDVALGLTAAPVAAPARALSKPPTWSCGAASAVRKIAPHCLRCSGSAAPGGCRASATLPAGRRRAPEWLGGSGAPRAPAQPGGGLGWPPREAALAARVSRCLAAEGLAEWGVAEVGVAPTSLTMATGRTAVEATTAAARHRSLAG